MKIAIIILGFLGLFGLLFNGLVDPVLFLASVSAILFGFSGFIETQNKHMAKFKLILLILFLLSIIICFVIDVFSYYALTHVEGNNYGGWLWFVPIIIFAVIVLKTTVSNTEHKSL